MLITLCKIFWAKWELRKMKRMLVSLQEELVKVVIHGGTSL